MRSGRAIDCVTHCDPEIRDDARDRDRSEFPGEIPVDGTTIYARANPLQRALRRFGASRPASWLLARIQQRLDRPVYRISRGRHTLTSLLSGLPVVMLTTTGARSGLPRSVPVLGLPTADGLAVIASNYGQDHHPAWYYNLRANPEGEVSIDGTVRRFHAREPEGEQRARIWREGLQVYPGWSQYENRASQRRIAVFLLDLT
jgi:deazaflavin-dependent oxidoreductase (nitroreductase family)